MFTKVRVTLKSVNDELARLGYTARLARASGYFYFQSGEAEDWLDRTVRVPTLQSLTLEQWIEQFRLLREKNQELAAGKLGGAAWGSARSNERWQVECAAQARGRARSGQGRQEEKPTIGVAGRGRVR